MEKDKDEIMNIIQSIHNPAYISFLKDLLRSIVRKWGI